jgi:hypothetical protein
MIIGRGKKKKKHVHIPDTRDKQQQQQQQRKKKKKKEERGVAQCFSLSFMFLSFFVEYSSVFSFSSLTL